MSDDLLAWIENAVSRSETEAREALPLWQLRAKAWGSSGNISPESVLRRCAADRKLIALHQPLEMTDEMADACAECEVSGDYPYYPCATLHALAEGYGWQERQRP